MIALILSLLGLMVYLFIEYYFVVLNCSVRY